jgi:hypothetical protein
MSRSNWRDNKVSIKNMFLIYKALFMAIQLFQKILIRKKLINTIILYQNPLFSKNINRKYLLLKQFSIVIEKLINFLP